MPLLLKPVPAPQGARWLRDGFRLFGKHPLAFSVLLVAFLVSALALSLLPFLGSVLVVQGDRDPFGCPPAAPGRALVVLPADHSLRTALPEVQDAVRAWLGVLLSEGAGTVGA